MTNSQTTVESTFASPYEPTLKPKVSKRVSALQYGFRITHKLFIFIGVREYFAFDHAQKNKINLGFVNRLTQIDKSAAS